MRLITAKTPETYAIRLLLLQKNSTFVNKTKLMKASNPRRTIWLNKIFDSKITNATAQRIMNEKTKRYTFHSLTVFSFSYTQELPPLTDQTGWD
jgi:hypothetical protein